MSERTPEALTPVDPERHALEMRIERAKHRIVEDLNRAGHLVRDAATRTRRGLSRTVLVAGVLVAGALLIAYVRLRGRRIRITWK